MKRHLDRRVAQARIRAHAARAEALATLGELRHRLDPRVVAAEGVEAMMARVTASLGEAGETARARPWIVAAGATVIGIVITALARSRTTDDAKTETDETNSAA